MIKLIKKFFQYKELTLSLDAARERSQYGFIAYDSGDYAYKIDDKWVLISNDKIAFKSMNKPIAMEKHVYIHQTKNLKWTLIINGKIAIENADEIWRDEPGVYICEIDKIEHTISKLVHKL